MNDTNEIPVEETRTSYPLQVHDRRKSSNIEVFDASESTIVAFRCTGKRFLPIFLYLHCPQACTEAGSRLRRHRQGGADHTWSRHGGVVRLLRQRRLRTFSPARCFEIGGCRRTGGPAAGLTSRGGWEA